MPNLSELTDPRAVRRAAEEFRDLGRDAFLAKYELTRSTDYYALIEGQLIDSKPLLAVAYSNQYPDRGLLPVARFSGGTGGAVRALTRLGFATTTRALQQPPELGDEYRDRTAIQDAYGGDRVAGIIRFPGDAVVNVFSDASGPYADDSPSLLTPFGYRGEGLSGPQRLDRGGNARLDAAFQAAVPVRFWYRPKGEPFRFLTWVVVLGRAWVAGTGQDGLDRPEIEWELEAVPGPDSHTWPTKVHESLIDARETTDNNPQAPESRSHTSYADLVDRVDQRGQGRRSTGVVRTDYARSAAARRAVLDRSGGVCESARCTGMPAELNRQGRAILDVDHIKDLALGGEDHPLNMVALCPNCHACKTRAKNAVGWRKELLAHARQAHTRALADNGAANNNPHPGQQL
ncbi:HNH endonuclease signature motif containing protein [Pedococcus sp. 5OH_020]|uniref:HNH endonuclease signature motif containing protein n=1 Tax=Pedococcus sp. 5OH_020 TaxID=2989814 RepID=UPI0022EA0959|nr:HNH endonuclease signature motif containing protein [Pedococcus sp. 5OH_020]